MLKVNYIQLIVALKGLENNKNIIKLKAAYNLKQCLSIDTNKQ